MSLARKGHLWVRERDPSREKCPHFPPPSHNGCQPIPTGLDRQACRLGQVSALRPVRTDKDLSRRACKGAQEEGSSPCLFQLARPRTSSGREMKLNDQWCLDRLTRPLPSRLRQEYLSAPQYVPNDPVTTTRE